MSETPDLNTVVVCGAIVGQPQIIALTYLLDQWKAHAPFVELDTQDDRCGDEWLRATVRSNLLDEEHDEWNREVFIDPDGGIFEWWQNPERPVNAADPGSFVDGFFVPLWGSESE